MPGPNYDFSDMSNPGFSDQFMNSGMNGGGGMNWQQAAAWGGAGDLLGAGLMGLGMSQYQNPSDSAMPYFNQAANQLPGYFQPYTNAGQQALPQLQQQYGMLMGQGGNLQNQYNTMMNNPGQVMNRIGQGFQQSPGYQFQTQQALGAANRAAAAGGMLGSPQEQQNIAGVTNQLANQDYYNYLNHGMSIYNSGLQGATNMYGMGLQGMGDLAHMGLGASTSLGEDMTNLLQNQAQLAYSGQANQNQSMGGFLGGISQMLPQGLGMLGAAGVL